MLGTHFPLSHLKLSAAQPGDREQLGVNPGSTSAHKTSKASAAPTIVCLQSLLQTAHHHSVIQPFLFLHLCSSFFPLSSHSPVPVESPPCLGFFFLLISSTALDSLHPKSLHHPHCPLCLLEPLSPLCVCRVSHSLHCSSSLLSPQSSTLSQTQNLGLHQPFWHLNCFSVQAGRAE